MNEAPVPFELAEHLATLPGRCRECLRAVREQGHEPGCPVAAEVPELPPLAWTLTLVCDLWSETTQTECGATEGVRHYMTGARCPECSPAAVRARGAAGA